ncbi:MAG: hypothetical protein GF308_03890 [Candidatus Heimdallarchaeota archaeon]|nr:hypothetical protein [Candidatus Heimdallarchaeota archaeon]
MKTIRNKILEFVLLLQSGKSIFNELNKLKKYEKQSINENLKTQQKNLEKILLYSWKYVPYYKKILEEAKVVVNEEILLENFHQVKILDKEILANNFNSLITTNKKFRRNMYTNYSGGSTGTPTKFIQAQHYRIREMAAKWYYYTLINSFPCKHIKLWGSERDIIQAKFSIRSRMMNFLQQRKILNSFQMTQKNMFDYTNEINKYKPIIIEAYAQSIYELAIFIKNNNLKIFSPEGIIASAGTLYPSMKKLIEDVFQCVVLNRYGTREVGDVACSCEKNQGLHMNIINNYIEILDDNLQPAEPGEIGQIYITKLTNFTMPLIRYKIGDLGIPSKNTECGCGRGFPLLEFVEGREMSVFKTKDGTIVPAEFFIHFIGVVFNKGIISKFQVIQNDYDKITIKYILQERENLDGYKKQISYAIRRVMGEDCQIFWREVDQIPNLPSGKYLYTLSEIQ